MRMRVLLPRWTAGITKYRQTICTGSILILLLTSPAKRAGAYRKGNRSYFRMETVLSWNSGISRTPSVQMDTACSCNIRIHAAGIIAISTTRWRWRRSGQDIWCMTTLKLTSKAPHHNWFSQVTSMTCLIIWCRRRFCLVSAAR